MDKKLQIGCDKLKNIYLYIFIAVIIGAALLIVGGELWQSIAAIFGFGVYGAIKEKRKKVKEEQKDLKEKADIIKKESDNRKEKADKLNEKDKARQEKADDLDEKLEKTDDKFKNMFNILLIVLISLSLLIGGPLLAQENINPDNFKQPDTLQKAEVMIDKLLNFTLEYRDMAYKYKDLYEQERKNKVEYKELYELEREDNKKLQEIIDNQVRLNDKLEEIIDMLMDSSKGGVGIYGGINYKPFEPLESGIEAGVSYDF